MLASGFSPVYPCHVPPRDMRSHPIGTGPFKFSEFKPNEYVKVTRNQLEKMYEQQSIQADETKRRQLVWEIDRPLQEDAARPMIFDYRLGTCRSQAVHGITIMVKSLFNGWRFEDAWLDR